MDERYKAWAKAEGLSKAPLKHKGPCLHWLAMVRCGKGFCRENVNEHKWMDHTSAWVRDGKPAMLLCQPYHLGPHDLRDLLATLERFNLSAEINGNGWYGFGTIAIELTRPHKAKFLYWETTPKGMAPCWGEVDSKGIVLRVYNQKDSEMYQLMERLKKEQRA